MRSGTSPGPLAAYGCPMDDLAELLRDRLRAGGQRPLLTFVDGATGERTELGHATFENWTAKAANLLVDEHGVAPGSRVGLRLPDHWTTAVAAVATWRVGAAVVPGDAGGVTLTSADVAPGPFGWQAVLAHDDHFTDADVAGDSEALPLVSRQAAVASARASGLANGERLLVTAPLLEVLVPALLGPLTVGGSVVLVVGDVDLDAVAEQEQTTRHLDG